QQARNLLMELDDHDRQLRFLIHDRDAKFPRAFDALLESDGINVIHTPVRAPNANAQMERWVGTVRRECLDRLLILGRRQLEHILRVYVRPYNRQRPHRALDLNPRKQILRHTPRPPPRQGHFASTAATYSAASSTSTTSPPQRDDRVLTPR